MYFLRHVARRALSSTPSAFIAKPRSIATLSSRQISRPTRQCISLMAQRRSLQTESQAGKAEGTTEIIKEQVGGENDSSEIKPAEDAISSPAAPEEANAAEKTPSSAPQKAAALGASPSADSSTQATTAREPSSGTRRQRDYIAPEDREPATTLYVGNLFFEVNEAALKERFEAYGEVKSAKIIFDHRGLSKGFGYVEFENIEDATKALQGTNLQDLQGRTMTVQYQTKRAPRSEVSKPSDPSKTLYIGNMSFEMSDKDMNDLFRNVRNCLDVRVAIDRNTGHPRGFAHADFVDVESATRAKELLQNKEVYGRTLRVDYTRSKPRQAGGSRERSDRS